MNETYKSLEDLQSILKDIKTIAELEENGKSYPLDDKHNGFLSYNFDFESYSPEIWDILDKIAAFSEKYKYKVDLKFSCNTLLYGEDIKRIQKINDRLFKMDGKCEFCDLETTYSLDEAVLAFDNARKIVEPIKNSNCSPLEKFMMIYNYLISRKYYESKVGSMKARTVIGTLTSKEIVCVGYAELMKFMCKEVGIECFTNNVEVHGIFERIINFGKQSEHYRKSNHENNVVHIVDEKYGIDGYFLSDACWDSGQKGSHAFCLFPLSDYNFYKYHNMRSVQLEPMFWESEYDSQKYLKLLADMNMFNVNQIYQEFGFSTEINPDDYLKIICNKSTMKMQAELLKMIMQKHNIPADAYQNDIPAYMRYSLNTLLALLINPDDNIQLVDQLVGEMAYHLKHKNKSIKKFQKNIEDIYAALDEYAESQYYTNLKINPLGVNYEFVRMEKIRELITKFQTFKSGTKKIPIEVFECAIYEAAKASGFDDKSARKFTNKSIQRSIKIAKKLFNKDAENCFAEMAYKGSKVYEN